MRNITFAVTTTLAAIALILSFTAFYHIRRQKCKDAYDRCIYACDDTRNRALGENQLRRTQINLELLQDLRDCRINNLGNQSAIDQCQIDVTNAAEQELAQLDAADNAIRQAHDQCATRCLNEAKQCDRFALPPIVRGEGDSNIDLPTEIDCLEGGAPCFKPVLEICKKISGPCDDCWKTLCGGGEWSLESTVPLEVTLVAATDPKKNARPLAISSLKGNVTVLSVPTDIKLNKREQLYFGFSSTKKPSGPVRVVIHPGK